MLNSKQLWVHLESNFSQITFGHMRPSNFMNNMQYSNLTCCAWRSQLREWYIFACGGLIKWTDVIPGRRIRIKKGIPFRQNKCPKGRHKVCWWPSISFAFPTHWLQSVLVGRLWFYACEIWATSLSTRASKSTLFVIWSSHCWQVISWRSKNVIVNVISCLLSLSFLWKIKQSRSSTH